MLQKLTGLKASISTYQSLISQQEDLQTLWELANEEQDEDLEPEIEQASHALQKELEKLEIQVLFSGPYDDHDCILTLHAGAGGTEAQDWTDMLYRMYSRFCEKNGFKCEVMDFLDGEEAGLKSITLAIEGPHAYGHFRAERGVHRLVRISPFDASARRHTSFASADVMPQVQEDNEVEINPDDLKIDTYRSGGAGGQHVNKTDSAVRITHLPTGIVVQCQNDRAQYKNRDHTKQLSKSRLMEEKVKGREREQAEIRGEHAEIGWVRQIRSYVCQPIRLVKDHRTNVESGNVDAVMDGDLLPFISGYLKMFKG